MARGLSRGDLPLSLNGFLAVLAFLFVNSHIGTKTGTSKTTVHLVKLLLFNHVVCAALVTSRTLPRDKSITGAKDKIRINLH